MKRLITVLVVLLLVALAADARVGGGSSYSGGGSSSSGGSSSGGGSDDGAALELIWLLLRFLIWLTIEYPAVGIPVDIVVLGFVIWWFRRPEKPVTLFTTTTAPLPAAKPSELRRFDPNFSEIVFRDFLYSLYSRVHHARGSGQLEQYAPYISKSAMEELRNAGSGAVTGIIVGALHVDELRGLDEPTVVASVRFESNMTEGATGWYVEERWLLERKRDILSPPPEKAKADHCPRCGAPLQTRTDGACNYCGVKIESGEFHWFVRRVTLLRREDRGPLLTGDVAEQGTDRASVYQPHFRDHRAAFEAAHPDFGWNPFLLRVREVAATLQEAWSARDWERVRPLETEGLFQTHRYWIDAYRAQNLRNVVDDYRITSIEPVKIDHDAFYEAITVRLYAEGRDYTLDANDRIAGGSRRMRQWSEYWTFVRTRAASTAPPTCPNCGAKVAVGATGVCDHCGGKLTSGTFDWLLSRIEQDEAYAG